MECAGAGRDRFLTWENCLKHTTGRDLRRRSLLPGSTAGLASRQPLPRRRRKSALAAARCCKPPHSLRRRPVAGDGKLTIRSSRRGMLAPRRTGGSRSDSPGLSLGAPRAPSRAVRPVDLADLGGVPDKGTVATEMESLVQFQRAVWAEPCRAISDDAPMTTAGMLDGDVLPPGLTRS